MIFNSRSISIASAALALSLAAAPAWSAPNLVLNGDFETTTMTSSTQIGYATSTTAGGVTTTNPNTVGNWTNTNNGYNFLFFNNATTATGQYGAMSLYTASNGGSGGNANLNSPTGGNFIASDGGFQTGAIQQTINNLSIGTNYLLSFYWAAAQQTGFSGATTEAWSVSFGSATKSTSVVTTPSKGFTPWQQATMVFSATSTSQLLSFLAVGTPSGQPPFSLLDGVSLVAAPEPSTWALIMTGVAGAAFLARRRRQQKLS